MLTIMIDFDGTCTDHCFPEIGQDVPHAVRTLKDLVTRGHRLIVWTMRSGEYLDDVVKWYADREIPLFGVNVNPEQHEWTTSPKIYAQVYVDDCGYGTHLIRPPGFQRDCVDWLEVRKYFKLT